jgi:hypothetical protein
MKIAETACKGLAYRDGIFKLLRSPGIDSASLCILAGRRANPFPIRFLDCSKIPTPAGRCNKPLPTRFLKFQHWLAGTAAIFLLGSLPLFKIPANGDDIWLGKEFVGKASKVLMMTISYCFSCYLFQGTAHTVYRATFS